MKLHKGQNGNISKRGRLESKIQKSQAEQFHYAANFASIANISLASEILIAWRNSTEIEKMENFASNSNFR